MFRLEGFVDDKNVVKVLHNLNGLVLDLKILPVVNAQAKNGKVHAKTNGDPIELLKEWLTTNKITEVRPAQLKEFCVSCGYAPKSYSYFLKNAMEAKLLKKKSGTKGGNQVAYVVSK